MVEARLADLSSADAGRGGRHHRRPAGAARLIPRSPTPSRPIWPPASRRSRRGSRRLEAVADRFATLADPYQREAGRRRPAACSARCCGRSPARPEDEPEPEHARDPGRRRAGRGDGDFRRPAAGGRDRRGRPRRDRATASSSPVRAGIPLFTGAGSGRRRIANGQRVAFDARRGPAVDLGQRRAGAAVAGLRRRAPGCVATLVAIGPVAGGHPRRRRVPVLANVGSVADAETAAASMGPTVRAWSGRRCSSPTAAMRRPWPSRSSGCGPGRRMSATGR